MAGTAFGKALDAQAKASQFKLVDASDVTAEFFDRKRPLSPYRSALEQLLNAESGKVLEFAVVSARASVTATAKKMKLKLLFAEMGGRLYVKIDGQQSPPKTPATPNKGRPDGPPKTITDAIRIAVHERPRTNGEVLSRVKQLGFDSDSGKMSALLCSLRTGREIRKDDADLCWYPATVPGKDAKD